MFDSITAFLSSASRTQPLVLVLEDLHWADHPSLLLLEFVARELSGTRLLVIGTYRDVEVNRRHPLSQTLGELTRSAAGGFQRVLLRGLDQEDVSRFIELVSGLKPPHGMVEAVHRQTEGNPLFVTEVVRLLAQERELTSEQSKQRDSWSVRIPEGVREVIGRRLDRLSERCNQTLTIASVIGREFTSEQLLPLIDDLSEDRLLEVMEEALASRVIEELPQSIGRYQFTHSLIQETLAGELNTTRRVRLHARIAEALEQSYGLEAEAHASELSFHFGEAASLLGSQKLISYSTLAGEQALATYAHEDALAYFQRGLSAKEGQPMDGATASLLFGLGRAQAAMFRRREALDCLIRAFDYYAEAGDVARAVAISEYPINPGIGRVRVTPLLERALALAPPDSHEEGVLLSRYGLALATEMGDYQRAQEALNRALEFATKESDSALEMSTWANAAMVDMYCNRVRDGVGKAIKAIGLAPVAGDLQAEANVNWAAAFGFLALGESDSARHHAKISVDLAERLRSRSLLASAYMANGVLHRFLGAWEESRTLSERGLAVAANDPRIKVTLAI